MKESSIERAVVRWAHKKGLLTTKLLGLPGLPDRVFWVPGGRPLLIEFKRPGEVPGKLQQHVMTVLKELDYNVIWCDDYESAVQYILQTLDAAKRTAQSRKARTR